MSAGQPAPCSSRPGSNRGAAIADPDARALRRATQTGDGIAGPVATGVATAPPIIFEGRFRIGVSGLARTATPTVRLVAPLRRKGFDVGAAEEVAARDSDGGLELAAVDPRADGLRGDPDDRRRLRAGDQVVGVRVHPAILVQVGMLALRWDGALAFQSLYKLARRCANTPGRGARRR